MAAGRSKPPAGGATPPLAMEGPPTLPNAVFDESGNFILVATLVGVKVVNLVAGRCVRVVGKAEHSVRLLRLALF